MKRERKLKKKKIKIVEEMEGKNVTGRKTINGMEVYKKKAIEEKESNGRKVQTVKRRKEPKKKRGRDKKKK